MRYQLVRENSITLQNGISSSVISSYYAYNTQLQQISLRSRSKFPKAPFTIEHKIQIKNIIASISHKFLVLFIKTRFLVTSQLCKRYSRYPRSLLSDSITHLTYGRHDCQKNFENDTITYLILCIHRINFFLTSHRNLAPSCKTTSKSFRRVRTRNILYFAIVDTQYYVDVKTCHLTVLTLGSRCVTASLHFAYNFTDNSCELDKRIRFLL